MSLTAGIQWEYRPGSGAANNGGGFNPNNAAPGTDKAGAGTTVNRDDIVIGADTTKITSAGTPFDATDNGNVIYLTGGTAVNGYYEIVSVDGSNIATLDRSAGTAGGSVTGNIGPIDLLTDAFLDGVAGTLGPSPGDTLWVKADGTVMTLTGSLSVAKDGTSIAPLAIIGYNTTRGDTPTGANRPSINTQTYTFVFDNYLVCRNLIVYGITAGTMARADVGCFIDNCSFTNTAATANRYAFQMGGAGMVMDCEFVCTNGYALGLNVVAGCVAVNCYIHDSNYGVYCTTFGQQMILSCIIEACTTAGVSFTTGCYQLIRDCTINGCGVGISGTTGYGQKVINNIISHNTTGASSSATSIMDNYDWNNWHGNTADVSNVTKGPNATANDPDFEGADDFRTKSGSTVRQAGAGIRLGVGAISKPDQGAWQSTITASGGITDVAY